MERGGHGAMPPPPYIYATVCAIKPGGGNASYWLFSNNGLANKKRPRHQAWLHRVYCSNNLMRTGLYLILKYPFLLNVFLYLKLKKFDDRIYNIDCIVCVYMFHVRISISFKDSFLYKTERFDARIDTICRMCTFYVRMFMYLKRIFFSFHSCKV